MSKKSLLLGAIASTIAINSVFADTTSTVTSQGYVDAAVATKQAKIPAAGTNAATPGETVVTYTENGNGTIGERGIYAGNSYNENTDANKLATADVVKRATDCVYENTQWMECTEWVANAAHTDENCLLMTVREPMGNCDDPFFGQDIVSSCTVDADCPNYPGSHCGATDKCMNGRCVTTFSPC